MKINENLKQYVINDFQAILNKRMMIIFAALFAIYTISDMGAVFFLIPLCFALIPFRRDEYQNISLPKQNPEMIRARYIFSLLLLLIVIFISFITSNIASMLSSSSIDLIPIYSIILMIVIFLVTAGLLLPLFYRYGFKKGQYFLYVLVIVFALLNLYKSRLPFINSIQDLIKDNPWYVFTGIGFALGGLVYIASYFISRNLALKESSTDTNKKKKGTKKKK